MTFESILRDHLARYPSMQVQDAYKLIHQAALGSEHAIPNPEGARQWMAWELTGMGFGPTEPMIDPISADGQIVRVHLRPFVAQGGDVESLAVAFLRTANEFQGNRQVLWEYWNTLTEMQFLPASELHEFIESMQAQEYPAVHHSPEYESLYRPAYRVVWRKFIS